MRAFVRISGLVVVVLVWLTACSTGSPTPSNSTQTTRVCFGPIPTQWSKLVASGAVLQNIDFGLNAVDDKGDLFGAYKRGTELGIAEFDGRFNTIATMPARSSGVTWMSYTKPWLVWAQGDSQYKLGIWSVHAWNSETGETLEIADSKLLDGSYLDDQLTFPVVGHGYLAWSTPTTHTSANLQVYRFDTHQTLTLDSGRLSSPVIAGHNLVWAKFTTDQSQASFQMVNADTLKPVSVPAVLAKPRQIAFLAGSKDYLAWTAWLPGSSLDGSRTMSSSLTVDRLADGQVTEYRLPDGDVAHTFQFPMVAGRFLVWFTSTENAVVDLQTGKGFEIKLPSSVAGNDQEIAVARNSGAGAKVVGPSSTAVSTIKLSSDLAIKSCS